MGACDEKNNCFIFGNCAGVCICRRTVHVMPVGLYCGGGRVHDNCGRRVLIGLYVRRHSNQLYRVQSRRVVHNVRPGGCIVYRRHWDIRIHRGVCNGINHPGTTTHENCIFAGPGIVPPLRRGELCPATGRGRVSFCIK